MTPGSEGIAPGLLRWTDAWLLAAIAEGQTKDEPVNLAEMLESADWLNRGIPSFDDVSYGLQRLVVAGLVTVEHPPEGGLLLRATAVAQEVKRARSADYRRRRRLGLMLPTLGSVVPAYAQAIKAEPRDADDDRTLGRLPGFERDDLAKAHRAYTEWFWSALADVPGPAEARKKRPGSKHGKPARDIDMADVTETS